MSLAFHQIISLLAAVVAAVALFRALHLPQLLAYLFVGIALGPSGAGLIPEVDGTRQLAEFGLVFLMFTLGLEFSLSQLVAMRRSVFLYGGSQVALTMLAFALLAYWLGTSARGAVVTGAVLAMSSTAVAMKLLVEQLEHNSRHGRRAFGILLFQDLIVVPFLILIPTLAGDGAHGIGMVLLGVVLKSAVVLTAYIAAGRWLLRPVFYYVAASRSKEFFMLALLFIVLISAWITEQAGLSLALGAFLTGLMIGETEYRHQVEVDILPFRDILLGLFFITTGMLLDLGTVLKLWPLLFAAVLSLIVVKIVIVFALGRVLRLEPGVALRTGLVLAQGGEFGFALITQAVHLRVLEGDAAQLVLAAIVLSMIAAPFLIRYNGVIAKKFLRDYSVQREGNLAGIRGEAQAAQPNVIICGYGRSGQNLAWMLAQEGLRTLALDLDPVRVRDAREAGEAVVYGDSTRADVLSAAGLLDAQALAISYNDTPASLRVLASARQLRPDLPVIVRTRDDADLERLIAAGATEVVPESLEGSLMIGSHVLLLLGVPVSHVVKSVRDVRQTRYRMLRGFFHGEDVAEETTPAYQARLHSVTLGPEAYAVGRQLHELNLDAATVSVTAVRRGGIRGPDPQLTTRFESGDVLVLYGTPEALHAAEDRILRG